MNRILRRRYRVPNNSIEEGHQLAGMGDLPDDLLMERRVRPPLLAPRGLPPGADPTMGVAIGTRPQNKFKTILTPWTFNGSAAGVQQRIVTANPNRAYLLIQNRGAASVFVGFGSAPSFDGADCPDGLEIFAGGAYELIGGNPSGGAFVPPEDIWMTIAAAANQIGIVTEGFYFPN